MFDSFLICKNTLQNTVENGKVTGFKFGVRIASYRGCILSLHNGYYIDVDGENFPRELQRFEVNGKPPRDFEEIKTCVWEHWDYDDMAYVWVTKEGGLKPGMHKIGLQQSILEAYGYRPTDEAWVKQPPVPGSGAGAGKTNVICTFDEELQA
jgi:hypothetical protein